MDNRLFDSQIDNKVIALNSQNLIVKSLLNYRIYLARTGEGNLPFLNKYNDFVFKFDIALSTNLL